jgi:energy-converting hydrogenase Eha subunit A
MTRNRSLKKSVIALTLSCVALLAFWNIAIISSLVLIILLTFSAIRSLIAKIHCFRVSRSIPTPLKATAICRINKEVERVLLYSRTRLAIASLYAIGIFCILAVAGSCLIVRKDLSKSGVKVKETFVNKLVKAN